MHKLTDIAIIAPALGRLQNQPLAVLEGNGFPGKLMTLASLKVRRVSRVRSAGTRS